MNKRRGKTSLKKHTSHFILRCACERELETEQRLQHIDLPIPSGHRRVSFSFSWAAQPGAWGPSLSGTYSHQLVWSPNSIGGPKGPFCREVAFPTTTCLQLVWSQLNRGSRESLLPGWWLSLPHLVSNPLDLQLNRGSRGLLLLGGGSPYHILSPTRLISNSLTSCLTELYNSSIAPLNLWNGMFDRHQAEITVMQFTDHSLLVHQSMSVPWDFYLVHFFSKPAYVISSQNCHRNVSFPSGASLWNGMLGRVDGQYTTQCLRRADVSPCWSANVGVSMWRCSKEKVAN